MLENYSPQAVKLIECAEVIAEKENKQLIGTEHLLLAMFEEDDTICHFLLTEEQITKQELLDEINLIDNNSYSLNNSKFTFKFNEIGKKASEATKVFKTEYVYDEHLFYTLLNDLENNATRVLINLGIDPKIMIEDILDMFNVKKDTIEEYDFLTNLTNIDEVHPYISRSNHLERLNIILNKKQKNNPMLIGSAGVGKTALVEGYAKKYKDVPIYRFELGNVVANTKYRGELEEKIIKAMNFINNNAILFIDEIHNIVGAGSNEGSLDIANILKPYLARNDIHCIGATTLDEYYKYIEKDKALIRRFHNIFIDEPVESEVKNILVNIKKSYEDFHLFKVSDELIDYIIKKTNQFLPTKSFPDKAIDVLDELGSRVRLNNNLNNYYNEVDEIIRDLSGIRFNYNHNDIDLNYKELRKYYNNYLNDTTINKPIVTINCNRKFNIDLLIQDLENISSFKKEQYLEIDLENYYDNTSINSLIGSTKGYVGYESGGILSEQIVKYPFSLIYIKNLNKAHFIIQNFIRKLLTSNSFMDNKGRCIYINNIILVVEDSVTNKKSVGLINEFTPTKTKYVYDINI